MSIDLNTTEGYLKYIQEQLIATLEKLGHVATWPDFLPQLNNKTLPVEVKNYYKALLRVYTVNQWLDENDSNNAVHETFLLMQSLKKIDIYLNLEDIKRGRKNKIDTSSGGGSNKTSQKDLNAIDGYWKKYRGRLSVNAAAENLSKKINPSKSTIRDRINYLLKNES